MTFRVNTDGIITSATSGREIVGSQVKQEQNLLDFVVIKRESHNRRPKYGLYGGMLGDEALVRTTWGDEMLNPEMLTPVLPSQSLIDHFISTLNTRIRVVGENGIINFLIDFVEWKYPNRREEVTVPTCSCCGRAFPTRMLNSELICDECYNNRFVCCLRCGRNVERSQAIRGNYCPTCGKFHFITSYHRETPPLEFYGDTHGNSYPYLGVELEVAYGGELDSTVAKVLPLINTDENIYMYCSHDSSLSDGIENITMPMTLEFHKSLKANYEAVFEKYKELDYLSHDTPCCGMHVHFNRNFYDEDVEETCITKLCYMFEKFWKEILLFSRRTNRKQVNRYCKAIDLPISEFICDSNKTDDHSWRYYALNLINDDTIEFRLFRGTLNIDTFFATLEFVQNMILASRNKTIDEVHEMQFADLLTTDTLKNYWKRMLCPRDL